MARREEVLPAVLSDLKARVAKGAKQYGERLTTHNGRDALLDAYEEALDLALYLKQAILERPAVLVSALPTDPEGRPLWVRVTGLNGAITTPVGVHVGSVHAVTRWDTDGSPIVRLATWGDFFLCGRGSPGASHNRCLPTWEPCAAPPA